MKKWIIWAIIFYIHSGFLVYKGFERITAYYMSEHSFEPDKFAYVGGDAYNYIINSNFLIGYFVLGAAFFLAGTIFIATGSIVKAMKSDESVKSDMIESDSIEVEA